jgi:PAS domain S-box-containing protein
MARDESTPRHGPSRASESQPGASDALFRRVFEGSPVGVVLVSPDFRFLEISPAFCAMLGYEAQELVGRSFQDVTLPEDRAVGAELTRGVLAGSADAFQLEKRYVRKDGAIVWGHVNAALIRSDTGAPLHFVTQVQDITERKRADQALRDSENRFLSAFEFAAIGMALVSPEGKWLKVNRAVCELVGYSMEELLAKTFQDITHAEDLDADLEYVRRMLAGEIDTYQMEKRYFRKDGRVVWVLLSVSLHRDAAGAPIHFISQIQDITERKRAERQLVSAKKKLEALWGVASIVDASFKELCDHVLETLVRMTESPFGFYGFIGENESVMTIYSWSGEAMAGCRVVDKPTRFPIADAGLWGDAIRKRAPLIVNDYDAPHASKRGLPAGHVPLSRLCVVPIFARGAVVAVAAVANRAEPYTDEDVRQIAAFLASAQAIVERRRADESVERANERLKMALEAGKAGTWGWDIPGDVFHWSDEFLQLFGMDLGTAPGFESWSRAVHPDDREPAAKRIQDAIEQHAFLENEYRIVLLSGEIRWIRSTGETRYGADGTPLRMSGLCADITDRKNAEEALRRSEARSRALLEAIPDMIFLFSRDGVFLDYDAPDASALVAPPAVFVGRNIRDVLPSSIADETLRHIGEIARTGATAPYGYDMEIGGERRSFESRMVACTNDTFLAIVRDITDRRLAEEALRESEERFRLIVHNSPDMTMIQAIDGALQYVSPQAPEVIGHPADEYLGATFPSAIHPDDTARAATELRRALAGEDVVGFEYRILGSDGEMRWLSHTARPFLSGGAVKAIFSTVRNITERRRAEEALRKEHENFVQVFRAAPVGLLLLDEETVVRDANASAAALVLRDPAELIGKRSGGALECVHSGEHPRGCGFGGACPGCPLRSAIEGVLRTGEYVHGVEVCATLRIEGTPQERWLTVNAEPVELDGRQHVIAAIDDVTERKRIEAAASASEMQYRALFDQAADGIMMMSVDEGFFAVNASFARMHGYSREELSSMRLSDIDTPETARRAPERLSRLLEGESLSFEVEHVHRDGHAFPLSVSCSLVHVGGKRYLLGFHTDLTERQRAEGQIRAQLEELQRWQDVMLDREDRVQELKREVNELCRERGAEAPYPSQGEGPP